MEGRAAEELSSGPRSSSGAIGRRTLWVAAFIVVAGAIVGGVLGGIAGGFYERGHDGGPVFGFRPPLPLDRYAIGPGVVLGVLYGLAVGLAWVTWMRLRSARNDFRPELVTSGVVGGLAAGPVAAVLVHTSLQLWFGMRDALAKEALGMVFGLLAGGVLGLLGGLAWQAALSRRPGLRPG